MRLSFVLCVFSSAASQAAALPQAVASSTAASPNPQLTACGDFIERANTLGGTAALVHLSSITADSVVVNVFLAKDVYDCLISVPFNPAVATRFIQYYNNSIQFHSTLAYLKNPPSTYQQQATDLIAGLNQIQTDITTGVFQNEYSFEATLQSLVYSAHDTHLQLYAGILSQFSFGSPVELTCVSTDGKQIPKIYISGTFIPGF